VSTSVPASPPTVRFAALRGRVPLPWGFVAGVAVTLALANAFVVVAVQGAIGAIERAQSPFTSWLRLSAILVPVFALAVTLALARADRRGRRTATTVLLVAAVSAAVGIVVLSAGLGSVVLLAGNLLLVAWVTALRGGRLDGLRRRAGRPPSGATAR